MNKNKTAINSSNRKPTVSLIILTWNSEKYIDRCIISYANSFDNHSINAEFIIVDNGSNDNTVKIIEEDVKRSLPKYCSLFLIKLDRNKGTTIPRNIALKRAHGKFIIICDSDTEFIQGDWRKAFALLKDGNIGIVAPSLYYDNGDIQHSVKKFPTLIDKLRKIPKIFFAISIKDKDFYEDFPWTSPSMVDTAISACWILTRRTIDEVGLLDENIFYSPEDLDYCLRIWESGGKVIFYPPIKITHHTQQISHKRPFSHQSLSHFKGLFYYFIKHRYCFSRQRLMARISTQS